MECCVSRIRTLQRFAGIFSAACGGGVIKNPQPHNILQGFAYCRLPGVSGTVHTTLHIEWTPAIREDHPLVLSMRAPFAPLAILGSVAATASFEDGTFQNVSYLPTFCSTLSSQSCCVQSLITPHNRPDPSHRWAIDGPDACILNGQPTYESPPATPPTDSSVPLIPQRPS